MAKRAILPGLLALVIVFFASNAMAADPSGSFTGLLDLIQQSASSWDAELKGYATKLFWGLAVINFVWVFFPLVFKQAELGEIVGELIRFVLTIGFFFALLLFSKDWADAVVESFRIAGSSAAGLGGSGLAPADVFTTAVELAKKIGDTKTWNPVAGVMIGLAAAIVMLCFAFIGAFMAVTLIESYIVINASVLFMGFGGSQWTREYALAIARYAVSVGAKLFVLTLIVGIINTSAKTWQAAYTSDDASMWTMVGLALACAYIAKTVPEIIQGIISGSSSGAGGGLGGMAAAAVAGATAGAAAASSFMENAAAAAKAADAGSEDLASSLSESLSGGDTGGNATGSGSSVADSLSGGSGSGAAGGQDSIAPRISGGSANSSSAAPSSSGSAGAGQSNSQASKMNGGVQDAAKQADSGKKSNDEQAQTSNSGSTSSQPNSAAGAAPKAAGTESTKEAAHKTASAAIATGGLLAALSVPGMEGAAGLSLGAAPQSSSGSEANSDSSDFAENSENTISSSGETSEAPANIEVPQSQNAAGPAPMDHATANGALQETAIDESDVSPAPKGDD